MKYDQPGEQPGSLLSHERGAEPGASAQPRAVTKNSYRVRNAVLIAGVSAYALMAGLAVGDPAPNAASFSQTTAGVISTTVPDGICAMAVSVTGGGGGSSGTTAALGGRGGGGAIIGARFAVLPGQAVTGNVGAGGLEGSSVGNGAGGAGTANGGTGGTVGIATIHRGGGGGGSSSISVGGVKVIEAGGGGGGGGAHQAPTAGNGGGGGFAGIGAGVVAPGIAGNVGFQAAGVTIGGGQGGLAAAGGAGGVHSTNAAYNGFGGGGIGVGTGGNGGVDPTTDSGGGGGGGYTGGGGGASTVNSSLTGGGAGGGSSFVRATSPTVAAPAPTNISGAGAAATAGGFVNGATGSASIDWIPCVYQLAVSKSASPSPVNAGARTIWTVAVTNSGPDPMTRNDTLTISDTLPAGPIGSPTPTFRVLSIGTSGGSNTNLASGAMTCTGVTVGSSMPASTTCTRPYSAPSAPGAPSGGARGLNAGETLTITYEQIFANTAAATTITNTASTVDRSSTSGTTDIIGVNANRSSAASVSILPYNLAVTKTRSAATIGAGQPVTWTINVTNNGPGDMQGPNETAANPLVVSDTAPTVNVSAPTSFTSSGPATGCTYISPFNTINCTSGLANGQTQTFTFQQTVNGGAPGGAVVSNTASVTDFFSGDTNDSGSASFTVTPASDLAVTKTNGVASVNAGGTTSYTVTVTNNGPSTATGATLSDPAVAGLTKTSVACSGTPGQCTAGTTPTIAQLQSGYALPALASGQTYQIIVGANVTALSGSVANTATIAPPSGTIDLTPANDSATDTDTVTPVANLAVTKTNGVTSVNAGGTTSYTVTVTNTGPSTATGATLSDPAVAGLTKTSVACSGTPGQCTAGTTPTIAQLQSGYALPALASGQTYQITVGANVTALSGSVANTATIAPPSGTTDPVPGNDSATDTDTVTPVADLAVTKTNGVASVNAGGPTSYTVTVTNNGPSTATGATLTDPAVAGLTKTSITCSGTPGQCTAGTTPTIAQLQGGYALPALASGQTYQLTVTANVTALSGSVANTATIAPPSGTTDPTPGNDSATDTDTVTPAADLAVTKTNGVASVNAGGTTSYTVTVTNNGPSTATGATLTDAAVAGLSKTSVVCSGTPGQCTGGTTPTVAQLEAGYALPALASGQTYQIVVAANVTALSGSVANTAAITPPSGTVDPTPGNDSATDTDSVTPVADLAITKTNGATSVDAGGTTTYTVTVTNNGPSSATGATLSDPAVAGLTKTAVACSGTPGQCTAGTTPTIAQLQGGYALPALASGQTYQITVTASVTATSGSVANTASIAPPSGTIDPTPGNDSATDTDTVTPVADLAVTKTNGVASVNAGGTTTYTVTVTNNGPSSATGATLSDPAVAGLTKTAVACSGTPGQCTGGTTPTIAQLQSGYALPALASGQTYQITVTANVTATSGSVANTATIAPPTGTIDLTPGNDSATDTDAVTPVADLGVTKTDGVASVNAGGTTTYTITVTNSGPSTATGAVLTDAVAAGLSKTSVVCSGTPGQCTGGTTPTIAQLEAGYALPALASGQTYQIVVTANVTALSGSIANTATIAPPSGTIDPTPGNDSATDTDTVTPVADLAVTKTNGVASVNAGGTTSYTITVTNNGPSTATGATLTDAATAGLAKTSVTCSGTPGQCTGGTTPTVAQLEAGYALPALASGQTYQIVVAANVTALSGSVANTATIAPPSGTIDPTPGNDSATDTDTVTPVSDLAITKTNGVASVNAGGATNYTITVTNNGPSTATGATLTDVVAAGLAKTSVTCSGTPGQCTGGTTPSVAQLEAGYALPALASGQTYQIVVAANVMALSGSVANTATIAPPSGTIDPTPGNDSATDTDTVTPVSDLAITKTNGVASVNAGGTTSYTITVTNNGPSTATGATLTDTAVAGLAKTSVTCSGTPGQCTGGTTPSVAQLEAGYALPALASGQTYQLTVNANVTALSGSVANTATIAPPSGTIDPTPGNDSATDTDTVTPVADLAITKTNGVASVNAGGTTTYTITVTNNGPSTATGATLTDAVVVGLAKTSVTCSGTPGQCTGGTTPTVAQLEAGYALPALASGETYQITVVANVTALSGSVANTATIAPPSGTIDPTPGNDSATDTDAVMPVADLAITKTNGVTSVDAGGTTTYTITVTNNGPSTATGATLTDAAAAGLAKTSVACSGTPGQCTGGTTPSVAQLESGFALPALASGQTYQIVVAANVTATLGSVANTAAIAPPSGTIDPTPANDNAIDTDTVNEIANLVTVKTLTSASATPSVGDTVTFQISVTNNGPSAATNVSLTDGLPAGLTPNGANGTVSQGSYNAGSGLWTIGSLANGATATLTLSGTVNVGQGGLAITNTTTAAATVDQLDPTTAGDDLNETVNVFLPPIVAADDSVGGINGASGGANVLNAFTGDTLNGVPATAATTTLVVASGSSVPAGLTFDTVTGNVSVNPGTAAGTYSFDYTICEIANPTNCDTATVSVTVIPAPIIAADDSVGGINGASGASNVVNAFTGDTLNGVPATAATTTLVVASGSSVPAGLTFNPATGNVSVNPATAAGTYSFDYTICEILNPTNCDTATISVTVVPAPIVAADDSVGGINGASGAANVVNAFTGDTLNGVPATAATTTLVVASGSNVPAGLTFNPATGNVSVNPGTAAGTYSFDYTICEILNPTNCDTATISVTVVAAPIVATNDSVGGINGASGGANVLNAFTGDTLNGVPATAATTTLVVASGSSVPAGLTFDTATGNVSVAPGTAAGTYSFDYTICEILNPTNCDTGTISVTVTAAPIVAADDSVGGVNGASGATNVVNAFTGDTLNGAPATAATTTLVVASGSSVPAGLTFSTATGNVGVAAGTAAGTYSFDYTICEILNPTNCDTGTISVTVVAAPIVAADDSVGGVNGASGASNVVNAFSGDTLNGAAATAATATLVVASGSSVPAGLTFDTATGNVSVSAGTAAGVYSFDYTICEILNPTNCDTGTISVTVIAAPIVANNDTPPAVVNGIGNANLINAFANDTLNGAPFSVAAITATVTTPASNPGVVLDTATGIVSVAPGVPAGDYTIQYQICEVLNATNCSSATIFVHVDPAVSAVTGTVFFDANGNHALDPGEQRRPNWIVEIFQNGTPAGTTTSDSNGDYQFTGLLSGPGYSIQFRNPENNVVYKIIDNLTLPDNATVPDQNLPIDPSGVVYDSVSRNPVAGAVVTLVDGGGTPLPGICFLSPTQQGQTTGASGQYRFDVAAGAAAQCPVGETVYRIAVTPPGGYSAPSTVLVPQAGPFDPTGLPNPALIAPSINPPAVGDPAVYYLTFRLASGDPDVIFNHIPIDPFLNRPPLLVTKTSVKRTASVGDLVPYTITVRNTEAVQRAGVTVVDILPPGFKYVPGSATVNGVAGEPAVAGQELTWVNQVIPANGAVVYKLTLVVGAGVTGGDRINTGLARNGADNSEISNRGLAIVAIVASTVFDCSEIIGKVFDDRDGDGYQDEGEPGIPAARLATVNGLLATTDEFGRYHITCVAVPNALIGSNFVLKLDPRSVPAGFAPTIDNPQSIRLTRGKMSELNFGVKKAEVREVNLDARAFADGGTALKPELAAKLKLLAEGKPQPLIVRINYRLAASEDAGLADVRLAQLKTDIEACFNADWSDVRPVVETNMDRADGAAAGEQTP